MYQHGLVLTLRDIFNERRKPGQPPAQCFAQDLWYNDLDKAILGKAGITVLQHPHGYLEVDDETVVVSISPSCPVRDVIAELAKPAVMI